MNTGGMFYDILLIFYFFVPNLSTWGPMFYENIFVSLLRIVSQPIAIEKTLKKYQNNNGCQNNGKVSK